MLLSGTVPPPSPALQKSVQDKILKHAKGYKSVNKSKRSWGYHCRQNAPTMA